jgi:hypothetical protein
VLSRVVWYCGQRLWWQLRRRALVWQLCGVILDWESVMVFVVPESWCSFDGVAFVLVGVNGFEGVTWFLGGDGYCIEVRIEIDSWLDIELSSSKIDLDLCFVVRDIW